MRNLILLFAILITGLVSAQQESIVISVDSNADNDITYLVVDREFNHVFDDGPKEVPFRIGWITPDGIILETSWVDRFGNDPIHWTRPQWQNPDEFPYLRYYVNGGMQYQTYAQSNEQRTAFIRILPTDTHLNFQWEWRGEVLDIDGNQQNPRVFIPRLIGRRWQPQRTN